MKGRPDALGVYPGSPSFQIMGRNRWLRRISRSWTIFRRPRQRECSRPRLEKIVIDLEGSEGASLWAPPIAVASVHLPSRNAIEAADVGVDDADETAAFDHPDAVRDLGVLAG